MSRKLNVSPQELDRWTKVGNRIRQAREAERPPMSMAQLGKAIHRSKGLIGQIERGEVNPRIHIEEIASALHHPIAFFLPSASPARLRKLPKRIATPQQVLLEESYLRVRDAFINPSRSNGGYPDIFRCWICGCKPGPCKCYRQCSKCGRMHASGQACSNPTHYQISNL